MKSIISNDRICWVCKKPVGLHKHHIYAGSANRALSEKYGCWVYLCREHHIGNQGVHFNHDLDTLLKKQCQRAWEKRYGDTEKFRIIFGRSYL